MKRLYISFLLISVLTLMSFNKAPVPSVPAEPQKHALIVAIGAYDTRTTGWAEISSKNDVPLIKSALLKLGFPESNISVIQDAQADRAGILAAFTALEQRTKQGDMVVVHFSSHGQQISDNNGEEVDGYDEAIVAFGAPMQNGFYRKARGADYDGSLHLRDEEVGTAVNGIRTKVGKNGHVLVIMDACHSGTGTRGSAKVRGGEGAFVLNNATKAAEGKMEDGGFGIMGEGTAASRGASDGMGKFVLISGAQSQEVNYETEDEHGNGVGSLTYCLTKALANLPSGSTYRSLFAKVISEMAVEAPKQTPQLEGDVDYEIFGGKFVAQKKYFTVNEIVDEKNLKINAGTLMSVMEGLPVALEKAGATEPSKAPLAKGKVTSVTNFESVITLDQPLTLQNKVDVWVFATGQMVPDIKVKVSLEGLKNADLKKELTTSVSALGMAEIVTGKSDLSIVEQPTRGALSLDIRNTGTGSNLNEKEISTNSAADAARLCSDMIQNYAQGLLFKSLSLTADDYNVQITRIIPVKQGSKELKDTLDYKTIVDKGNVANVTEESYIYLELKNNGRKVAYFNIIDLEPGGKINALLPKVTSGGVQPPIQELSLQPREKRIFKYPIRIMPPYGNEVFKVISTGAAFDLASTIKAPAAGTRGSNNPIQRLVGSSFDPSFSTRGGDAEFDDEMGSNTSEFVFKIVRKK